jgi:hypothetical protein
VEVAMTTTLMDRLNWLLWIAEREKKRSAEAPLADEWPTLANIDKHVAEHRYGRTVILGKAPEPFAPGEFTPTKPPVRPYSPIRVIIEERDKLYGHVQGLLGLVAMLRQRDDIIPDVVEILFTNHRVVDAEGYIEKLVPPRES